MIKWITIPDDTKKRAYVQIAEETGMSAVAVEKDARPFDQIIEELYLLKERINALPWGLTRDYPLRSQNSRPFNI